MTETERLSLNLFLRYHAYLSEGILGECLVSDQVEEANSGSVEGQNVFIRAGIFQLGVNASNL